MSDFTFDFGGVEANSGFKAIPEGTYDAVVYNIEVKNTKPKEGVEQKASDGTPAQYLNVQYKIIDEKEDGKYKGRYVWGINSIRFPKNPADDDGGAQEGSERTTREMLLSWLNTVTGTDFAGTNQAFNPKNLLGSPVRLVITHKEYQGDVKENIKKVMPAEEEDNVDTLRRMV